MSYTKRVVMLVLLALVAVGAYAADVAPAPFVKGSWTLVLLPDTQYYASKYPDIFISQCKWIADHAAERDIRFVMSEGDVTNNNTPDQWEVARAAFKLLDGKVPYALQLGNHDYYPKPLAERATLVNQYFPPELVRSSPAYGGAYERNKLDNAYYLFSAGGRDWIALSLEFAPRDAVLRWANVVLDKYADRSAIICTHAYIDLNGKRYDYRDPDCRKLTDDLTGLNDGQAIWEKLASKHANVVFVFCGHVTKLPAARLASVGDAGNIVHEIMADYQGRENGGDGYLRLVEFLPDGKTVHVNTYSTTRNDYLTDADNEFTLEIAPAAGKAAPRAIE